MYWIRSIPETYISETEVIAVTAVETFEHIYIKPRNTAFTPYRICPIGAHSDHQLGKITGFAINQGIHIAFGSKENGVIEIQSLQFEKRAQWHVNPLYLQKKMTGPTILRVFCQVLFPEKSVGIPFFQQGIFPAFSGHYASLRMRACSIR